MPVFSTWMFPLAVAACYVLGQLSPPIRRTTWFGLLNLCILAALFGIGPVVVLLILCAFYWAALRGWATQAPGFLAEPGLFYRLVPWALYLSVAVLFGLHKLLLEPVSFGLAPADPLLPPDGAWTVIGMLQTLAVAFICLRLIDFIRSVVDGAPLLEPVALSGYLAPFFMTPAGPINVYTEHLAMDVAPPPPPNAAHFIDSLWIVIQGYFLKFVVSQLYSTFFIGVSGSWPTGTFMDTAVFMIYVLFEFWGYSLIALGVGRLLGVPTPVNFNHPYLATSVSEFWTRWHISLGSFARRNLYTPLQVALVRRFGRTDRRVAYVTNLFALWLPFALIGIWHRVTPGFLLWGLTLGTVIALEKLARDRIGLLRGNAPIPARWLLAVAGALYTWAVVIIALSFAVGDFAP